MIGDQDVSIYGRLVGGVVAVGNRKRKIMVTVNCEGLLEILIWIDCCVELNTQAYKFTCIQPNCCVRKNLNTFFFASLQWF
jgi:hypothetical protein